MTWTQNGNLISQTDGKGHAITFTYDELNRLTQKQATDTNVIYTYDDPSQKDTVGKLCKVIDNASQTTFQYDNLGREISTTKTIDATPYTVQRTYDGVNRLTSLTYPDGETVNYTYNNRSQIEAISSAETTYLQNADYNQNDQLTQITLSNGVVTHYTYNDQTKLLSNLITTDSLGAQIQNLSYNFDNIGNILGITDAVHSTNQTFAYDNLSRLTSAVIVGAGAPPARYYTYDAVGNITSKDGITYQYNSTRPHAVTDLSDGSAYTYDGNGNMQTRHTPTTDLQYLNYNSENRLTSIQDAFQNTICSFVYDGDGGRIKKTSSLRDAEGNEAISTTTYIGSLYEIERGADSVERIVKHIFKGSTRLASKTGANITYYHGDHLGSSNLLTDENGLEIKRIEYEPFGTSYINEGSGDTNYRFTGKELDAATGLYYYGARYYDAKLGRFITADSIVQSPYDPQTLNRYSYCRNNPLKYTDPTGHKWSWKKFWNGFAGAFIGAVITVVTAGAGTPLFLAGMYGGMVGGTITGGLEGGLKGAVIGAAAGGVLGGLGGAGVAQYGASFAAGMLVTGTAVAAITNSWDSFAGGLAGGICGTAAGATYQAAGQPGSARNQLAVQLDQQKQAQRALCINPEDSKQTHIGSRPAKGTPFGHMFDEDKGGYITEMGPGKDGNNTVFRYNKNDPVSVANAIALGDTPKNTMDAIGLSQVQYSDWTKISESGFNNIVSNYESTWSGELYVGGSFNSNYALKTWIYGSGGEITGLTTWRPSFSGRY